jgi:hypothetical protein
VVISQIDYLEHVRFPLARELWETIAGTLRYEYESAPRLCSFHSYYRTAIKTLAKEQPIAQALGDMSDNASDSASGSVSAVCDLSVLSKVADH